jgi:hypothetical protein
MRSPSSTGGTSPEELPKLTIVLDNVSLELSKQRDQFRLSIQSKVDNPLDTIEKFNKQFRLGEKERGAVEWGWNQGPGNTMFHLVNVYTREAQFEGLPAETGYRLLRVPIPHETQKPIRPHNIGTYPIINSSQ